MKNKTNIAVIFLLAILCLLASCATPQTVEVVKTEYKPIELDLTDSVDRLYETRPRLMPDVADDTNVLVALVEYKDFGEAWMSYSFRLEDYINILRDTLAVKE